ncbi:hypothetical protein OEA41_010896 [Lepraria neglecta]|uniref:Uncharacterized protein n=1 Tax=Lepraria neglecta TaxID=209136 RepID=A0AAD9Z0L3_9LECA|nr:hypothetical protein OEA41_010896 [Lepraria neglecta]
MSALLTIQASVYAEEAGKVEHAADMLRAYRARCLLRDGHTPFGWILTLRSQGRRIRNNTTSAGYITWADDRSSLTFKDITLDIKAFRGFLRQQTEALCAELSELYLPQPYEQSIPRFDLGKLRDNPANAQTGWSFLQEPQNDLARWQEWLINRVLDQRILREQFFQSERRVAGQPPKEPQWQVARVRQYLELLRRFLTRLSMLIFILGGQPARGTELFSLRYRNTFHGGYRNIYIEQGLLGFVTLYHKGYSIGGSLKIIHRYLPPALSQVVVQYLVLVLPFSQQLSRLVYDQPEDSAFLWARAETTWDPSQLSHFLRQESARELQVPLTISSWRHTAIAISREFIPKGTYFDREADSETSQTLDRQACHSNNTAGTIYGRLVQDGDGQIREFRERYRRVSLLWHTLWLQEAPSEPLEPPVEEQPAEEPA